MNEADLAEKKRRITLAVKVVLLVGACAVLAPVVFLAIKGLVGLIVAGVIALVAVNLAPVFAEWVGDWRLKAIKAAAAANPIETLQLDYAQRQEALGQFRQSITNFVTAVKNFEDRLDGFKKKWPEEAPKFEEQREKMKEIVSLRRKKLHEAEASLVKYDAEIDKAKALWEMAQEAAKMNKAAGMKDDDFMAKIKVETAIDSVTSSMNSAFAELETSLDQQEAEKNAMALLEHKPSDRLVPLKSSEEVKVKK